MHRLTFRTHFDAAHFLRGYDGKCANLHGHRWHVEVEITGSQVNQLGILIDFKEIKELIAEVLPDHCCLNNDIPYFETYNPTAENIARWLFIRIDKALLSKGKTVQIESLELWESEDCSAIVRRGDFSWQDLPATCACQAEVN